MVRKQWNYFSVRLDPSVKWIAMVTTLYGVHEDWNRRSDTFYAKMMNRLSFLNVTLISWVFMNFVEFWSVDTLILVSKKKGKYLWIKFWKMFFLDTKNWIKNIKKFASLFLLKLFLIMYNNF